MSNGRFTPDPEGGPAKIESIMPSPTLHSIELLQFRACTWGGGVGREPDRGRSGSK